MHLCAYTNTFSGGFFGDITMSAEEVFDYFHSLGIEQVELGAYGTPGHPHIDVDAMMSDDSARENYRKLLDKYQLQIADFCCHGNAVHPVRSIAEAYDKALRDGILLAERMQVPVVIADPGCPGGFDGDRFPNWQVACTGIDASEILDYQWNKVLIPYWSGIAKFAHAHGVKVAFEIHGGSPIHNARTFLKLREAVGSDALGVNYDFAQLMWQGIDTATTLRLLDASIYHIHCKDCRMNVENIRQNGYLDVEPGATPAQRPWNFCTMGHGHDAETWKDIFRTLKSIRYAGALSIEQEDKTVNVRQGFESSVRFVKDCLASL